MFQAEVAEACGKAAGPAEGEDSFDFFQRTVFQDQLDDVIRIFVYADTLTRVRRVMEVDKVDEAEALRRMKRIDKERTEYHRYFTGREWMDMENYDLPINASRIDYDQMIQLIKGYLKLRGYLD